MFQMVSMLQLLHNKLKTINSKLLLDSGIQRNLMFLLGRIIHVKWKVLVQIRVAVVFAMWFKEQWELYFKKL